MRSRATRAGGSHVARSSPLRCAPGPAPAPPSGPFRPLQLPLRSRHAAPRLGCSSLRPSGGIRRDAEIAAPAAAPAVSVSWGPAAPGHATGEAAAGARSALEPPQLSHLDGKLKVRFRNPAMARWCRDLCRDVSCNAAG